ncbi:aminotransferase class I/II-fold pyridoxal phosphate-dependent enzyme [Klebsiella pneumoniae]|nr:aminotransferase class I/II-fold pyridoxal phosphate-dependent enzyme [Klebsiella pneumoniae]
MALAGGELRRIALQPPHLRVDWVAICRRPERENPAGDPQHPAQPFGRRLAAPGFCRPVAGTIAEGEIYVLSDEVYEHICFAEGRPRQRTGASAAARKRAVAVSSFGKTFHMTGWKVGYCVAPAAISAELRKVHQYPDLLIEYPGAAGDRRHAARSARALS